MLRHRKTQECSSIHEEVDEHVENYLKSTDGTISTKDVVDLLARLGVSYTILYT